MELNTFLELYPNVSRQHLARICQCSDSTVEHWFGNNPRPVKAEYKLRLAIAHYVWSQAQNEPKEFQELRQMWAEMKDKD